VRDDAVVEDRRAGLADGSLDGSNLVDGFDLERQVVQAGRCGDECAAALLEQRDQQFSVTGQASSGVDGAAVRRFPPIMTR